MNILNIFRRDDSLERERDAIKSELAETVKERDSLDARFKQAVHDMAAQADEIAAQAGAISSLKLESRTKGARNAVMARRVEDLEAEVAALKTDAEKLRSKRANGAALNREKRAAAKIVPIKAARR